MRADPRWILVAALAACDGGGGETAAPDGGAVPTDGSARDGAVASDASTSDGAAPPIVLEAVPGDLVYSEGAPGDLGSVHLFSATATGGDRHRITRRAGGWTYAAVAPDPRYVAAVRHEDADGDGEADPTGRRAVWIIDVEGREEYPITPADCDAGIGGVGWRDDLRVVFAMSCDGEPAAAWLANRDNRGRERPNLLKLSDHAEPVRDVFPAVGTPLYAYVVDAQACDDGRDCVAKPQVWIADHDAGERCRVTDGDAGLRDRDTVLPGGAARLGDHQPTFNGDLSAVVFSRNVAGKPAGPEGHHDLFRIGLDLGALYGGREECGRPSSLERLSDAFVEDAYALPGGPTVAGDERFPATGAGRGAPGTLLYTAQARDAAGNTLSQLYFVDVDGSRHALTPSRREAGPARWIVDRYTRSAND